MQVRKHGRTILIGEDDLDVRSYLETALRCQGYAVAVAENGTEVLACLNGSAEPVSAVVMDVIMPHRDGIDTLKEIRRTFPDLPVIMMSGAVSPVNVVEAMKNGAADFMAKPIHPENLRKVLRSVLGEDAPVGSPTGEAGATPLNEEVFFGTAPTIRELQNLIAQIGWSEVPVLIQGETGSGKEIFARELHSRSPRAKRTLLKINCAALPSELVESELFGYERGAFTGAFQKKLGMFELADGGTILLDEIGDMDFRLQAKLLQVLQDQEFQRLGGKECVRVDVRVIAATHRDLEKAISDGTFREDLYYRLNVVSVQVPPLRERRDDIIPMAEFLARKHAAPGSPPVQFPLTLQGLMRQYDWPGNIRQLENVVRKYLIIGDPRPVEQELRSKIAALRGNATEPEAAPPMPVASVPAPLGMRPRDGSGKNGVYAVTPAANSPHPSAAAGNGIGCSVLAQVAKAKREEERTAILDALTSTNWNRRRAAVLLEVEYKALLYKMNVLNIRKEKPVRKSASAAPAAMESCA